MGSGVFAHLEAVPTDIQFIERNAVGQARRHSRHLR